MLTSHRHEPGSTPGEEAVATARALHGRCPGRGQCDCQHRVTPAVARC